MEWIDMSRSGPVWFWLSGYQLEVRRLTLIRGFESDEDIFFLQGHYYHQLQMTTAAIVCQCSDDSDSELRRNSMNFVNMTETQYSNLAIRH